jgi:hypothetical protein
MTEKELLIKMLFDDPKREHVNVKFFRGRADSISEEALSKEVSAALFQFQNGLITAKPTISEDFPQIDVKELELPC